MAKPPRKTNKQVQREAYEALTEGKLPEVKNQGKFRCLNDWPEEQSKQTWPPSVPVHHTYLPDEAPTNQVWQYKNRTISEEAQAMEESKMFTARLQEYRRAAEAHRTVRRYIQDYIQPGMSLYQIAEELERVSKIACEANGIKAGRGFPTGLSLNDCAAHYTPNPHEKASSPIFTDKDILKVDFGTQVNGLIIDSAFSICMDETWDPLLLATREATNKGLEMAGPDALFGEIATEMGEVISSYEVEKDGKMMPVVPIRNLNGHSMERYVIHAGKSLPFHKCSDKTRMEEGEVYAIETFATCNGKGYVEETGNCSHYMMHNRYADMEASNPVLKRIASKNATDLLQGIQKNFGSLAFCRRWLDEAGFENHGTALNTLCRGDIVLPYPPLNDVKGSMTSQFEHTVWLRPTCKEVLSRGPDY